MPRIAPFLLLAALVVWGCGSETETASAPESPVVATSPVLDPSAMWGSYEVEGTTVEVESGRSRRIQGTVILSGEGSGYSAKFSLKTTYPTPDGPLPAEVIGTGSGDVKNGKLRGTAQTQLVMATVPGVDTGFGFVPTFVGPRIVSSSVGSITADGMLTIEVENEAAPGVEYPPTRTTLKGKRIPPAGDFPTAR